MFSRGGILPPSISADVRAVLMTSSRSEGHVNVYDLYSPCIMSMYTEAAQQQQHHTDSKRRVSRAPASSQSLQRALDAGILGGPDGCINAGAATIYLDNPTVQAALHVAVAKKSWHIWCV